MKISEDKLELLRQAHDYCDGNDKSTESMIVYMQDFANASFDEVMEYLLNSEILRNHSGSLLILTLERFNTMPAGIIIRSGICENSPKGLYMTDQGGKLKWIMKKGQANDWAIYCGRTHLSEEEIARHGDKVYDKENIMRVCPVDEEVWKLYRF